MALKKLEPVVSTVLLKQSFRPVSVCLIGDFVGSESYKIGLK